MLGLSGRSRPLAKNLPERGTETADYPEARLRNLLRNQLAKSARRSCGCCRRWSEALMIEHINHRPDTTVLRASWRCVVSLSIWRLCFKKRKTHDIKVLSMCKHSVDACAKQSVFRHGDGRKPSPLFRSWQLQDKKHCYPLHWWVIDFWQIDWFTSLSSRWVTWVLDVHPEPCVIWLLLWFSSLLGSGKRSASRAAPSDSRRSRKWCGRWALGVCKNNEGRLSHPRRGRNQIESDWLIHRLFRSLS